MSDYYWVVPFFTLPEFPEDCVIVHRNDLLIRDVLCCNPINPHIFWGGQHDPQYEHPFSPEFKMCHSDTRSDIYMKSQQEIYDNIYLVFRANKLYQNKTNTHYFTGYYKIDQENVKWDHEYEDPTLYASDFRLLNENDSIDVTDFLKRTKYYRFPFSIEAGGGAHYGFIMNCINEMSEKDNEYRNYVEETTRLENLFKYYEFEDGIYECCNGCSSQDKCPLVKRISSKGKLNDSLPPKISEIIREFYKSRGL